MTVSAAKAYEQALDVLVLRDTACGLLRGAGCLTTQIYQCPIRPCLPLAQSCQ